ncbi:succinylglutamate desuccinylase/aspartoacylase family protein [Undibacterium fentianense]|uniref:Succinylglutamate desuccinylase/aspartoacylase family protein n=1 Tax=Undibacterium fentianense TaxID=2828728 RepID=A0A941E0B4_9BURK|nr:succinylglutamate desuccinylase/aspartoacylase family protein [Undibacterium fentianense]MBR7798996.1 succinylglutamate desuccinylase/aspartoacylase family protein [Undibacterium fentianense]
MRNQKHLLPEISSGSQRTIHSWHFGRASSGKKVYIQSSLHADEIPGMLVSHYLREALIELERANAIAGEIVLVPVANPVGLAQDIQGSAFGRFDLASGINFNRGYQYLTPKLETTLRGKLGTDLVQNTRIVREHARAILNEWQPNNEVTAMKKILQSLAIDADIVLDLHCDNQAVMHLYTGTPLAEATLPLAQYLGARALLLSVLSGDDPFDESCSRHWWELAEAFGPATPIALGCQSVTVELRGESDVGHANAQQDAEAIIQFLMHAGHIEGNPTELPQALCAATPLEGSEPIVAARAGILAFTRELGELIHAGESIGDLIDPISGTVTPLIASVTGVFYARVARRYAQHGMRVAKIAGHVAYRSGNLLSM